MPRIRGTPRRGAAWYTAESRRKRKAEFEKAMAIAARRRREKPRTPPMAVVEEEIPEGGLEALQNTPYLWSRRTGTPLDILAWLELSRRQVARALKVTAAQKGLTLHATWRKKFLPRPPEEQRDIKARSRHGAATFGRRELHQPHL
jgi:hypothetical protein